MIPPCTKRIINFLKQTQNIFRDTSLLTHQRLPSYTSIIHHSNFGHFSGMLFGWSRYPPNSIIREARQNKTGDVSFFEMRYSNSGRPTCLTLDYIRKNAGRWEKREWFSNLLWQTVFSWKKNKTKLIFSKINKFRDSPSYYLIIRYSIVRTNYRAYFSII